jgi:DNA-binding beta-propeller fold protein YncE
VKRWSVDLIIVPHVAETLSGNIYRYGYQDNRASGKRELFGNVVDPSNPAEIKGPDGMKFGADGHLYVASQDSNEVHAFDGATGAPLGAFVAAGAGGLAQPLDVRFGPDGALYAASFGTGQVLRFQGPAGSNPGAFEAVPFLGLLAEHGSPHGVEERDPANPAAG